MDNHEAWREIQKVREHIADLRYDLRKEMKELDQATREELYDVRMRLMRLEAKLGEEAG